jgi:hypothetical protein
MSTARAGCGKYGFFTGICIIAEFRRKPCGVWTVFCSYFFLDPWINLQQLCSLYNVKGVVVKKGAWFIWAFTVLALIAGCSSGNSPDGGSGALSLSLSDSATEQYRAVYVTIDEVMVHLGGDEESPDNWKPVMMSPKTVNLLELVNGVREELGVVALDSGHYTQMRLIVGQRPDSSLNLLSTGHPYANYIIDQNDPPNVRELKIPGGHHTGIKIVHGFNIDPNFTTELILDFDAHRSVVQAGSSGKWLLKPTIRVAELTQSAIIEGTVTSDDVPGAGIEGALVSVQRYNAGAADPRNRVVVDAATVTDANGNYQLIVAPGKYLLVVCAPEKQVSFGGIEVSSFLEVDRVLAAGAAGQVSGDLLIPGGGTEQHAVLSFRQKVDVEGAEKYIEIKSVNVLNAGTYSIHLPANPMLPGYTLIASSLNYLSQTYTGIVVPEGGVMLQNISLLK